MQGAATVLPLYFAYGSNLEPVQMERRCPGHRVLCRAMLHDHALAFHGTSRDWGGAVATCVPAPGRTLHGVVFELTAAHFAALDAYEDCHGPGDPRNLYHRVRVAVELENREAIEVFTYVMAPAPPGRPSRAYRWAILSGMRHHGLPAAAIDELERTKTID